MQAASAPNSATLLQTQIDITRLVAEAAAKEAAKEAVRQLIAPLEARLQEERVACDEDKKRLAERLDSLEAAVAACAPGPPSEMVGFARAIQSSRSPHSARGNAQVQGALGVPSTRQQQQQRNANGPNCGASIGTATTTRDIDQRALDSMRERLGATISQSLASLPTRGAAAATAVMSACSPSVPTGADAAHGPMTSGAHGVTARLRDVEATLTTLDGRLRAIEAGASRVGGRGGDQAAADTAPVARFEYDELVEAVQQLRRDLHAPEHAAGADGKHGASLLGELHASQRASQTQLAALQTKLRELEGSVHAQRLAERARGLQPDALGVDDAKAAAAGAAASACAVGERLSCEVARLEQQIDDALRLLGAKADRTYCEAVLSRFSEEVGRQMDSRDREVADRIASLQAQVRSQVERRHAGSPVAGSALPADCAKNAKHSSSDAPSPAPPPPLGLSSVRPQSAGTFMPRRAVPAALTPGQLDLVRQRPATASASSTSTCARQHQATGAGAAKSSSASRLVVLRGSNAARATP